MCPMSRPRCNAVDVMLLYRSYLCSYIPGKGKLVQQNVMSGQTYVQGMRSNGLDDVCPLIKVVVVGAWKGAQLKSGVEGTFLIFL